MSNKKYIPSEAEFEARLNAVLRNIFPTFENVNLRHQETFTINFGHRNITFSSKDFPVSGNAKGIYDVLLTIGERNVILFELKREGHKISKKDINQGLSYGRLINPMPPITVISNGSDTRLFNTYSWEELLNTKEIDIHLIETLISKSAVLATNDLKNTISVLLNNEPKAISNIFNTISENNFNKLVGDLIDFSKPIGQGFLIPRKVTRELYKATDYRRIIGLIGAAFSGKTTTFYDFFKNYSNENNAILYLDLQYSNYSIFEQLANSFTRELNFNVSTKKVKEWLRMSIREMPDLKLVFLFDNYNDNIHPDVHSDIHNIIDLIDGTKHSLIYSIDEINFKRVAKKEHRNYNTILGTGTKKISVEEFDDDEYNSLQEILWKKFKIVIQHGGQISNEYREPRVIRIIGSLLQKRGAVPVGNQYGTFPAIPNFELIKAVAQNILSVVLSRKQRNLLRKFVEIYLSPKVNANRRNLTNIATVTIGALPSRIVKEQLSKSNYKLLKKSGFVIERHLSDKESLIIPKIPELISFYGIESICNSLIKEYSTGNDTKSITDKFLTLCRYFSYSDIVGEGVLLKLEASHNYKLFSDILWGLLKHKYKSSPMSKDSVFGLYFEDTGFINLRLENESPEAPPKLLSDNLPYLIVSQLLSKPIGKDTDVEMSAMNYETHLDLLWTIGSYEGILTRNHQARFFRRMKSVDTYEIKGYGTIVSSSNGIVEPIIQSIQQNFLHIPHEIKHLYEEAIQEKNISLLWRIYLALRDYAHCSDSKISDMANQFLIKFDPAFSEIISEVLTDSIEDESLKIKMQKAIRSAKKR